MKDPAFLFYSSDFLTGTMTMNNEQVGMYIRLLCLQHQKGFLTKKDMLYICLRHDDDIFNKFALFPDGNYYNVRLAHEIEKRDKYTESRRLNRISKTKKSEDMTNICQTYDPHMENENINDNIIDFKVLYKSIIEYLNKQAGTAFRSTSQKTKDVIKARLNEKFKEQDFYTVIDKKCIEWLNTDMAKYLRPETLFSNKFEGYLNQKDIVPKKGKEKQFEEREYKEDDIEDLYWKPKEG
jgi:uncharacterized phage protein (TIGR02220 family)